MTGRRLGFLPRYRRRAAEGAVGVCAVAVLVVATALPAAYVHDRVSGQRDVLGLPIWPVASVTWEAERTEFRDRLVAGYGLSQSVADEFSGWILEAAARHEIEPELLASLVMTESSFRKHVRSVVGAVGPAQVRPHLWQNFCGVDLEDPEQNLYCGAQILAHFQDVCARLPRQRAPVGGLSGTDACALSSYNVGYGNQDHYFVQAAARYLAKVDRYRSPLIDA